MILNLKNNQDEISFFKCLIEYLGLKISNNQDKKTFIMEFSKADLEYIKKAGIKGIEIIGNQNKML